MVVFDEANLQTAAKMKAKHKEYRTLSRELEKQHYDRIMEGMTESIESSKTHLEFWPVLGTIDSHATSIARSALDWKQNPPNESRMDLLSSQRAIRKINDLAARESPFVFLISFSGEENLVSTPEKAAAAGFFLDMPGMVNHSLGKARDPPSS